MDIKKITSGGLILFLSPLLLLTGLLIKIDSLGPVLFKQKRLGKRNMPFIMYKFRTMINDAESKKDSLKMFNEAEGPVFKIKEDPRFTKFGKILANFGLDELPQLINVLKGEMSFVGPRPLPLQEAAKIPKKYQRRTDILPGITSLWVIKGGHALSFKNWMELDIWYIKHKSLWLDIKIGLLTVWVFLQKSLKIKK